ncbi:hypothetical protein G5B30_11085 [Sphingobacterium sp. SGG-5]|uniref:hypothetical protein n=1 Tax=Sphingobacterium sp. SGG-5 TaxID=2710881 RepID=UPI0013ED13C5|nr:hypothetical protein [Sphingobacterium sp. SGG-5]NGM62456.1 hypothetical protein [Sphingobacterium sp. SGG-5]
MTKILTFFLFIQFAFLPIYTQAKVEGVTVEMQDCEQVTHMALQKLVPAFQKNDLESVESILNTIQSTCGESEFTVRIRILCAVIEHKLTEKMIDEYIIKGYKGKLERRWKYSMQEKYAQIYQDDKAIFDFVPLKHPIDLLAKAKAVALLNTESYILTEQEESIMHLFANQESQKAVLQPPARKAVRSAYINKQRGGVSIYAGAELPWTGIYPLFKTSPTLGMFFSTKLSNPVLVELGFKLRFNTPQNEDLEYLSHDEIEIAHADFSMGVGGTVGLKAFDNNKIIISPKLGLFWEQSDTGLGELVTTYYEDGDESYEEESVDPYNINTMRTTIALAVMRHLVGRTYIGLEGAYHFVPYNWDKHLVTRVQPHYGSLQLFFRF